MWLGRLASSLQPTRANGRNPLSRWRPGQRLLLETAQIYDNKHQQTIINEDNA